MVVMVMMGLDVEAAAFSAAHHQIMGILVGDIDQQLCLATAAAVGLITPTFAQRTASGMDVDVACINVGGVQQDHIKLGHGGPFARNRER
jgi:hypothetical protein